MPNPRYSFPEKNPFKAREVTDIDFDIKDYEKENLYIQLDEVRIPNESTSYINDIKFMLNIDKANKLETLAEDYVKIILSGHRGSGKTAELRRIHKDINNPERYFSVKIELEEELEIDKFEVEDFYIILIIKLIRELKKHGIKFKAKELDNIIEDWISEEEIKKEITRQATIGVEKEVGGGFSFLSFFKFKLDIKGNLSAGKKIATEIRKKVKQNPLELIRRFNLALDEIRKELASKNKGRDIVFVVDGSERIPFAMHEQLFIQDSYILRGINVNLICTVRLDSYYLIEHSNQLDFFEQTIVPMIRLNNDKSIELLKQVITKRIDEETFFEKDVLNYFVEQSGGSIRQLIKIVHKAILYTRGKKINIKAAKDVCEILGKQLLDQLTSKHRKILYEENWKDNNKHNFSIADEETSTLVFALVLMKYNDGIEINPLLDDMVKKNIIQAP